MLLLRHVILRNEVTKNPSKRCSQDTSWGILHFATLVHAKRDMTKCDIVEVVTNGSGLIQNWQL